MGLKIAFQTEVDSKSPSVLTPYISGGGGGDW